MINLKHLLLVQAVVEEGTLTRAGEKLFLSQSALSHQLKEMEQSLGLPVFHRVKKRLVLTETGHLILNSAMSIMKELESVKVEINQRLNGQSGRIRMATECYTTYHWLPGVIKKFNLTFPNVEIQIITENVTNYAELLLDGKLDLALAFRLEKEDDLEYQELFNDELVAVVSKNHPWSRKKWIQPADLENETLITHVKEYARSFLFEKFLRAAKAKPKKVIYLQLTETNIEMVKAGLGVTIASRWVTNHYNYDKSLSFIPLSRHGLFRKWFIVTRKTGSQSAFMQYYKELILSNVRASV